MIRNKKILALIPARGGSKRLPNKNILTLSGKPLIFWTLEAALKSDYIDRIIVSTDDESIAKVVNSYEVEVPELRPSHLSDDNSTTLDVILYILDKYRRNEEIVILLQPTSPFRNCNHIDEAINLFIKENADAVISVTECEKSPLWCNILPANGNMDGFIKPESNKRTQDLDKYYQLNGAIYIFDIEKLIKNKEIVYNEKTFAYVMNSESSIDIDTDFDLKLAKYIASEYLKSM